MIRRAAPLTLTGVALTLVAFTFDAAPLFVVGIALATLGLGAPACVWCSARGTGVQRHLSAQRVLEQEPLRATFEVRRGRLPLARWELRDPLASAPVRFPRAGRTVTITVSARFERRGRRRLDPPSLVLGDALGVAQIHRVGTGGSQELIVLPRTEPVRWSHSAGSGGGGQSSPPGRTPAASDLDGLRRYRPGTPASRIHWPALARGAGLLERRLEPDPEIRPLIVLDARGSGPGELVDAAVRAAASLALELARAGGCGLLLPGERRPIAIGPELAAWDGAQIRLALVQGGPLAPAPMLRHAPPGPVYYVAARALGHRPAALRARHAHSAFVLVVAHPLAAQIPGPPRRALFTVCGCSGFRLTGASGEVDSRSHAA
ncbi:MAG: DUF58 domain-containing protein [Solirubrobacteraceae bacterium]